MSEVDPPRRQDQLERWLADGYATAYRTAFLILHNRPDAEEAVQEAFLRAWRFRAAVPDGEGVRPWMYRVVVNACLSKLRSERSARTRTTGWGDAEEARTAATGPGPDSLAELGEAQRAVVGAIAALPEHLRVVVVLRFYAGMTEQEIGTVIHRRPGTVKSRIHQAKMQLSANPALLDLRPEAVLTEGSVP